MFFTYQLFYGLYKYSKTCKACSTSGVVVTRTHVTSFVLDPAAIMHAARKGCATVFRATKPAALTKWGTECAIKPVTISQVTSELICFILSFRLYRYICTNIWPCLSCQSSHRLTFESILKFVIWSALLQII